MTDARNRKSILQKATDLRRSTDDYVKDNIFINPDQTKKQQIASKNLRDTLRATRSQNPNKTYKISKGEIVEVQEE